MSDKVLAERRVVVFGAGTTGDGMGNGQAAAILYARAGARVVAVDFDEEALAKTVRSVAAEGGIVEHHLCNIADEGAVRTVVEKILEGGPIDIAHNNVGIFRPGGILEAKTVDFKFVFDVNVGGAFNIARAVLPGMIERRRGVITNISSYVSQRFWRGMLCYQVSKAALESLSMTIALEYADKGIRCNTILPGTIDTPLARDGLRSYFNSEEALSAGLNAASPTGVAGTPWDVANAAVFLASDAAAFVNGVPFILDGGAVWRTI